MAGMLTSTKSRSFRPRVSFAAAEVEEAEIKAPQDTFFQKVVRQAEGAERETLRRKSWVDSLAQKLAAEGGWGISFDSCEGDAPQLAHSLPLRVAGRDDVLAEVRVVKNALPVDWCERMIVANEKVGYTPQRQVELTVGSEMMREVIANLQEMHLQKAREMGSSEDEYERGKNTSQVFEVWSPELAHALWARISPFVPATMDLDRVVEAKVAGIIPTFRFMKYAPGAAFKAHRDPARFLRAHPMTGEEGAFKSAVTIALFLNDYGSEFEGGQLAFLDLQSNLAAGQGSDFPRFVRQQVATVDPQQGWCAIFPHNQRHESTPIISGVKHMFQIDVAYEIPKPSCV